MTTDMQSAREDLAFLRGLVDEDWRPRAWAFGVIYVVLGAALVAHVLISWGAEAGYLPLQGRSLLATYLALYTAVSSVWALLGGRFRRELQPGMASAGVKSRAGAAALIGSFLGHLVMLGVFVIVALRLEDGVFLQLAPLVLFTLQGVLWFVVHALRRQPWQLVVAIGWLLSTLALAPFVGTDAFGLGVAAAAVALMIIPGVQMMRIGRSIE